MSENASRSNTPRRGVAVVLALVAVSVATMLGIAFAGSTDAHVATSARLRESAAARCAAAGALDLAGAIVADPVLRAELELLSLDPTDTTTLFESIRIGDATVRAELVDLATGRAASLATHAAELRVEAEVGEVHERLRAVGRLGSVTGDATVDLDGSEFAILGTERVSIRGEAVVGPWRASPLATLGEPIRIGAASGEAAAVAIDARAATHGCLELRRGPFPADADAFSERLAAHEIAIPAAVHVPKAPMPVEAGERTDGDIVLDGLVDDDLAPRESIRIPARASTTIRGGHRFDIGGDLVVGRGARLYIEGTLAIVVRGDLVLDACSVECAPDATLTFLVFGESALSGSYLGGTRSDPSEGRDATGGAAYDGGAARVMVFGSGVEPIALREGTVLKGQVYAPDATIEVASRSAVYGRLLGRVVTLGEGVALFYDPLLDSGRGWTWPSSALWRADGAVDPAVELVESLDAAPLLAFAEASGVEPELSDLLVAAIAPEVCGDDESDGRGDEDEDEDDDGDHASNGNGNGNGNGNAYGHSRRWSRLQAVLIDARSRTGWSRRAEGAGLAGFVSLGFDKSIGGD